MDAGALDLGTVAGGRSVVDSHAQAAWVQQRLDGVESAQGHMVGLASDGADGGVGGAEVVVNAGSAEPGRDGASAGGEEDATEQQGQAGRAAGGGANRPGAERAWAERKEGGGR